MITEESQPFLRLADGLNSKPACRACRGCPRAYGRSGGGARAERDQKRAHRALDAALHHSRLPIDRGWVSASRKHMVKKKSGPKTGRQTASTKREQLDEPGDQNGRSSRERDQSGPLQRNRHFLAVRRSRRWRRDSTDGPPASRLQSKRCRQSALPRDWPSANRRVSSSPAKTAVCFSRSRTSGSGRPSAADSLLPTPTR